MTIAFKLKPSRRVFLRGLGLAGGNSLLSPIFGSLVSHAFGEAAKKVRFGLFLKGAGLTPAMFRPKSGGETDFKMPDIFAPMEPHRSKMLLVEQFANPYSKGFHGNGWATLSLRQGQRLDPNTPPDAIGGYYKPSGISLDRYIAKKISGAYPIGSINLSILGSDPKWQLHASADGVDAAYPSETNPVRGFASIFGKAVGMTPAEVSNTLTTDRSILDALKEDIARMQGSLAGEEKAKLDQYLTSIRALENKLAPLAAGDAPKTCGSLKQPAAETGNDKPGGSAALSAAVIQAQTDLMMNALLCGRTPVAAFSILGNAASHRMWPFCGEAANLPDKGLHGHHHQNRMDLITKIYQFSMNEMARLYAALASVPEPGTNGSMADNTLLMHVNTGGFTHHQGYQHAVMLLGNANNHFKTGRYVKLPTERPLSDIYVNILNALGISDTTFGQTSTGAVPQLKA
jgi:hypothetical protein